MCKDLRDGALERLSCADLSPTPEWGAFVGAGEDLAAAEPEFILQESSKSTRAVSSLELESGLLVQVGPWGSLEDREEGVRRRPGKGGLSLGFGEEQVLEELFCSEEWEERESMLPIGVLPELLLNVSPAGAVRTCAVKTHNSWKLSSIHYIS